MANVPELVTQLVEHFDRNLYACGHAQADRDSYLAGGINETQLRRGDEIRTTEARQK